MLYSAEEATFESRENRCVDNDTEDMNTELERARRREIAGYLTAASFPTDIPNGVPTDPRIGCDPVLNALVQLGTLRLDCDRAFLSLIDDTTQYICTEMTKSHPLTSLTTKDDRMFLGCCKLDPEYGVCPLTMRTFADTKGTMVRTGPNIIANRSRYIISDFRELPAYVDRPYVVDYPFMVSYLEVPLVSPLGYILGSYCVVDNKPRQFNDEEVIGVMTETATAIMHHLDSAMVKQRSLRSDSLISMLSGCTGDIRTRTATDHPIRHTSESINAHHRAHEETEITDASLKDLNLPSLTSQHSTESRQKENEKPSVGPKPQRKSQTYMDSHIALLEEAAEATRDALNLDGLVFLDAVSSSSGNSDDRPATLRKSSYCYTASEMRSQRRHSIHSAQASSSILAKSIRSNPESSQAEPITGSVPSSIIQRLIQRFPQGTVFTADEHGPISDAFAPGVVLGSEHEFAEKEIRSDESVLFEFLPQAQYILFMPLWHIQRECWFTGMLAWNTDSSQAMDQRDVNLLSAFGQSAVSKIAYVESQTMNQVKSDFIASISHELKSPLHGIVATTELLRDQVSDPSILSMIDMIESCGSTLLDTFDNLLDYARINGSIAAIPVEAKTDTDDKMALGDADLRAVDIGTLVEEVVAIVALGHSALSAVQSRPLRSSSNSSSQSPDASRNQQEDVKRTTVLVNIEAGYDWLYRIQVGAWKRIVMNLIGNALKYTKSGVIVVDLSPVQSSDEVPVKTIQLSVQDSGIGISPTFLRYHLFTSFSQENTISPGSGLGLSLVRQLVHGMNGEITVSSEQGKGTLVEVALPLPKSVHRDSSQTLPPPSPSVEAAELAGLNLCYISSRLVDSQETTSDGNANEVKRLIAVERTVTMIAKANGMTVTSVGLWDDYPPSDMYFYDEDTRSDTRFDIGSVGESPLARLATLSSLIVLNNDHLPTSKVPPSEQNVISIKSPIAPNKLRVAFLESLKKGDPRSLDLPLRQIENIGGQISATLPSGSANSERPIQQVSLDGVSSRQGGLHDLPQLHVLLVDDNAINLKILVALMDKLNQTFESATDGLQAVEAYQASIRSGKRFDAVLMDISMPIMNGFTAARRIRQVESDAGCSACHVIALTGLGSEAAQLEASASGFDRFLKKPFKLKDIEAMLRDVVRQG